MISKRIFYPCDIWKLFHFILLVAMWHFFSRAIISFNLIFHFVWTIKKCLKPISSPFFIPKLNHTQMDKKLKIHKKQWEPLKFKVKLIPRILWCKFMKYETVCYNMFMCWLFFLFLLHKNKHIFPHHNFMLRFLFHFLNSESFRIFIRIKSLALNFQEKKIKFRERMKSFKEKFKNFERINVPIFKVLKEHEEIQRWNLKKKLEAMT
jgi:hypothetical protein